MSNPKSLILEGKRWRKFHEFTFFLAIISLVTLVAGIARLLKIERLEWEALMFTIIPGLFLLLWIPYKSRELRFSELITNDPKTKNHDLAVAAINNLRWTMAVNDDGLIEAYNKGGFGRTWGNDMITIVIENNRLLINSLSNLDRVETQAFFTFGKHQENVERLKSEIERIKGTIPNKPQPQA